MVKGMIKEGNNRIYSIGKTEGGYKAQRRLLSSQAVELEEMNDGSTTVNSSTITGNTTDVSLLFGARATLNGNDIGVIICDGTALSRGDTVCP